MPGSFQFVPGPFMSVEVHNYPSYPFYRDEIPRVMTERKMQGTSRIVCPHLKQCAFCNRGKIALPTGRMLPAAMPKSRASFASYVRRLREASCEGEPFFCEQAQGRIVLAMKTSAPGVGGGCFPLAYAQRRCADREAAYPVKPSPAGGRRTAIEHG